MTDEEKKAQLEAEAEAKAKAEAEAQDAKEAEAKAEADKANLDKKIDYKAEYEKMVTNSKLAYEERKEKRENKEKEKIDEEEDESKQPVTKSDLEEFMARQNQATEEKIQSTKVDNLISNATGSADEAMLVKKILNDTVFPNGYTLEQRVKGAIALANSDKLVGENSELKRALKSKDGVSSDTTGNYQEGLKSPVSTSKLSKGKELILKQQGIKMNEKTKRYEKKISETKVLVYDVKTNRNVVLTK